MTLWRGKSRQNHLYLDLASIPNVRGPSVAHSSACYGLLLLMQHLKSLNPPVLDMIILDYSLS